MIRKINFPSLIILAFQISIILSCSSKISEKPNEIYKLWAGEKPPDDIIVLKGKYWQSGHFTKEYEMYLKLKASNSWIKQFVTQNKLRFVANEPNYPSDAPDWFKPLSSFKVWEPSGFNQGSVIYVDYITGPMFIYEIQL